MLSGAGVSAFAIAARYDAAPAPLQRSLCNAQQPETVDKAPGQPATVENSGCKGSNSDDTKRGGDQGDAPSPAAASASPLNDAALSLAAAAAAEASAAAAATITAALDAVNAVPSPGPAVDPATNVAAAAEVIYASGVARAPSVLDSQADSVAQLQQHAQIMVGDDQKVNTIAIVASISS